MQKLKAINNIQVKGYSSKDQNTLNKFMKIVNVSTDGIVVKQEDAVPASNSIKNNGNQLIDISKRMLLDVKGLATGKEFSGKFNERFSKMNSYVNKNIKFTQERMSALTKFLNEDIRELEEEMKKEAEIDKYMDEVNNSLLSEDEKDDLIASLRSL